MYKPRGVLVTIENLSEIPFEDEVIVQIPNHKEVIKKLSISKKQSINVNVKYDEQPITTYKYKILAKVVKDSKEWKAEKVFTKSRPQGFFEFFANRSIYWHKYYHYWCSSVSLSTRTMAFHDSVHGTDDYLRVKYHDVTGFLESGFNYKLHVMVVEHAGFGYGGHWSCVSYPNRKTRAFVDICGSQDDLWDYVYHDKSEPEVRLYVGGNKIYNTIMTGAYKGRHGYVSDCPAVDEFDLILTQVSDEEYQWKIENFKRYTTKSGRVVLTNLDFKKDSGKFKVVGCGVSGIDATGKEVNVYNAIPIRQECYVRVGRASDVTYSAWSYCKTECYITIKEIKEAEI